MTTFPRALIPLHLPDVKESPPMPLDPKILDAQKRALNASMSTSWTGDFNIKEKVRDAVRGVDAYALGPVTTPAQAAKDAAFLKHAVADVISLTDLLSDASAALDASTALQSQATSSVDRLQQVVASLQAELTALRSPHAVDPVIQQIMGILPTLRPEARTLVHELVLFCSSAPRSPSRSDPPYAQEQAIKWHDDGLPVDRP